MPNGTRTAAPGPLEAEGGPHLERGPGSVGEQHGRGVGSERGVEAVEHLGQKVVELEVRKRGVGDALEASGDPGRLTRVVEQVGTVEGERHPAGDVLGDCELPGAERRALVAAGEQHHSERSSARCQRHEHRRPHVELLHDVDVLGALKQVVQHLLCEVRDHLRLTVDEHATDVRGLRIGGICAQALGERGLLGTGMSDGDPLEAAASVDDVDHDHVRQPRSGEPRDALKAGPRFDRCGDDLACLHQELEPPLALCLLGPLGFEHDGDDAGGFAIRMFQRAQGGVYPHGRAVAAPDVETALPRSPAGRPLADLPREGDLIVGDDEVDDGPPDRGVRGDAEQLLGSGVPDCHPEVSVGHDDGCRSLANHIRRHDLLDDAHGPPCKSWTPSR